MWQWLQDFFDPYCKVLEAIDNVPQLEPPLTIKDQIVNIPVVNHPDLPPSCGIFLIQTLEGFRDTAYQDQKGVWTIGYGRAHSVKKGDKCTKQQAMAWLAEDCGPTWQAIQNLVKVPLTQNQGGAILSVTYNIGIHAFMESGILRALNHGSLCDVPAEIKKWNKITINGVPTFNQGLANRRKQEINLFVGSNIDWRPS